MKYLLDSNVVIALTMNADDRVVGRAGECFEGDIVTSAIAIAEVALGSVRGKPPGFAQLQAFLEEVPVLAFDIAAARAYAALPLPAQRESPGAPPPEIGGKGGRGAGT